MSRLLPLFQKYTLEFILLIVVLLFYFWKNPADTYDRSILSDGKGYYAYLPAILIYNDLTFAFEASYEQEYYNSNKEEYKHYKVDYNGSSLNKYFPGVALLMLPFFLLAHILSLAFGYPADGYSILYQYSISLAALCYFYLGLRLLRKTLRLYTNQYKTISLVLLGIALGTNLLYYTIIVPSFSHVYNFFLLAAFFYILHPFFHKPAKKSIILIVLVYSLIIVSRPQNVIVILLIPYVAGSWKDLSLGLRFVSHGRNLLFMFATAVPILLLPSLLWYLQTGSLLLYSYGNEGFDLSRPQFFSILFSFDKGWFLYTPLALLSFLGLFKLYRLNVFSFWWMLSFWFALVYLNSSWWVWNFYSVLSNRVFVDFYAITAVLLCLGLLQFKRVVFIKLLYVLITLFILWNLVLTFQHVNWIFPFGKITSEIFFKSAFKLNNSVDFNCEDNNANSFNPIDDPEHWIIPSIPDEGYEVSSAHPFSPGFVSDLGLRKKESAILLKFKGECKGYVQSDSVRLITELFFNDIRQAYMAVPLELEGDSNDWREFVIEQQVNFKQYESYAIKAYMWNNSNTSPLKIRNLNLLICEEK